VSTRGGAAGSRYARI